MEYMAVKAVRRSETGKRAARRLRKTGTLPAVMYNSRGEAVSLAVNEKEFTKVWRNTTRTTLITLFVDDAEVGNAFIKATEYNIVADKNLHVDFHVIDMDKILKKRMKVHFLGTPSGVREGGHLVNHVPQIEIQCLPKDLPVRIETDISGLSVGATLRVKDLALGEGVQVLTDAETPLLSVAAGS